MISFVLILIYLIHTVYIAIFYFCQYYNVLHENLLLSGKTLTCSARKTLQKTMKQPKIPALATFDQMQTAKSFSKSIFSYQISYKNLNYKTRIEHENHNLVVIKFYYRIITICPNVYIPAGKIEEKAMQRSVFLCIWHCIFNADSTKTPSSSVTFQRFCRLGQRIYKRVYIFEEKAHYARGSLGRHHYLITNPMAA